MFILCDLLTPLQDEFSDTKQGRKKNLVCLYTAGSGGTVHLINHFQSVAGVTCFVRVKDQEPTVLCLYGKLNATLKIIVADDVGTDTLTRYRR